MTKNGDTKKRSLSNRERLSVMEQRFCDMKDDNDKEHGEIKTTLTRIDTKLDTALEKKADKSDLETLDKRIWGVVMAVIVAVIGTIAALIQSFFN